MQPRPLDVAPAGGDPRHKAPPRARKPAHLPVRCGTVIIRCADRHSGHWCPVCGLCTCIDRRGGNQARQWSDKVNARCKVHGTKSLHPHGKVINYDFVRLPNGLPGKVVEQPTGIGWDV